MKRKRSVIIVLVLLAFVLTACTAKNVYDTNVMIETKFTTVVQKYAMWKAVAPVDVKERWKAKIDPLILQGDKLLDSYSAVVKAGGNTEAVLAQIDIIITQILIELAAAKEAK